MFGRPEPKTVKVNDVVMLPNSSRYGVVNRIFNHGARRLANIEYIDPSTGDLMVCPDTRCQRHDTCPIHQGIADLYVLRELPPKDLDYLSQFGMLLESIATKAKENHASPAPDQH